MDASLEVKVPKFYQADEIQLLRLLPSRDSRERRGKTLKSEEERNFTPTD